MTHGQHTKASQLLGCVKHNGREPTGHLRIQTNLDTSLNLDKERLQSYTEQEQVIGNLF